MDILCIAVGALNEETCGRVTKEALGNCSHCFDDITDKAQCLSKPLASSYPETPLAGELTCYHVAYANQQPKFTEGFSSNINLDVLNECTKNDLCMEYVLSGRQIEMMKEATN
jgi:hypothetical protein